MNSIWFCVSVPVLSEKMYSIWPRSSFRLVVRHIMGVSVSAQYILRSQRINSACHHLTSSTATSSEMGTRELYRMRKVSHASRTEVPC